MFGGIDPSLIQKYAKDFQKKLKEIDEDLKERIVEGTAGGGMVKVKVNGLEQVVAVEIDKEVIDSKDKTMIEDLVTAAVNEGVKKAKALREQLYLKATGMSIGGLFS